MKVDFLQPTLENDLVLIRPLIKTDFAELYNVASDPLIWEQHSMKDRYQLAVFTKLFETLFKVRALLLSLIRAHLK